MDDVTERPIAERVRTVLARGAAGTVGSGLLTRPLRSARVRDDGVIVLVVDVGGMSREVGESAGVASVGGSAAVEIVDTVCTGRCRRPGAGPSFAVDGRPSARDRRGGEPAAGVRATPCDDECAVARGVVTISGIVTASSAPRRRRLVAADGGPGPNGEAGSLRLSELQPLGVSYLCADGAYAIPRGDLAAAAVDPIGIDEQAWLRRLGADSGLAARLALRAGRQIAGTRPWIVGIDRFGLDLSVGSATGPREVVRIPFALVCGDSEDVQSELDRLAG
ncbi:MAG: DUF2470 domain-containing protein [Dietzia sp.]|uniref:DUF2470 domain-containing protein n=2 Tax=Dietzia cercidiphylli TaxID=498199 RepID=A0ABN2J3S9_9ACTN|nr:MULTISPECIES: DUF2470 domain-containing protein [Dietzia]MBC7295073.1 hypothetical protein [Dietzia sp.]MCT1516690.1 DUF2470 domain-containing protein [Dietzia cercidiphylli]MDO8393899.1 DUF2470 domain-containing protein [Dietzia sp.]